MKLSKSKKECMGRVRVKKGKGIIYIIISRNKENYNKKRKFLKDFFRFIYFMSIS